MENIKKTSLDAGTHAYIMRNWEFLAAMAWDGYKRDGQPGVIVINMSLKFDGDREHTRAFYMFHGMYDKPGTETEEWVNQFVLSNHEKLSPPTVLKESTPPVVEEPSKWYLSVHGYDPNRQVVFIGLREGDEPGIGTVSHTPTPEDASELQKERRVD